MTEENKAVSPEDQAPEVVAETPAEPVTTQTPAEEVAEVKTPELNAYEEIVPGMTVRIHQKIREFNTKGEEKERIQVYEGIVLARQHGKESGATITVRKVSDGIGVEKIFPIYSPNVVKIEPVKQAEVRHAKLYYLRNWKKKLKEKILKNDK